MTRTPGVLTLSLISHTNAGKTTLARTLLRRDVGEVLDQAHVTRESERFVMLDAGSEGDGRIELWDTPGFGDSARLLRELEGRAAPLEWLQGQRFDPVTQRALHSSQHAVQNVVACADVILYLVNASEDPASAGYVDPEMKILAWTERPVIVVLNQVGSPQATEERRRAEERWRWHLASHAAVRDVISLDAFTRCWVQEGLLLLRLQALVPESGAALMARLLETWRDENLESLEQSAEVVADLLLAAATDREPVAESLAAWVARRRSANALARRLEASTRGSTDRLIALHGLAGDSAAWVRGQLEDVALPGARPDPLRASLLGGVVGGAIGGLAADLAHAGLTLGGGAIAGALAGALGLGGLAWAYEQLGGEREPAVVWSSDYLARLTQQSILRYLAVAHFGRGTGRFRERMDPAFWAPVVERELEPEARNLAALLRVAREGGDAPRSELVALVAGALRRCLIELYPGAERFLG